MKKNMGSADRIIRVMLAALVAALYLMNVISGTIAIVLLALAAVFILTSLISVCPLYLPFGLSTFKKKSGAK
jgi:fatty acid desaturase